MTERRVQVPSDDHGAGGASHFGRKGLDLCRAGGRITGQMGTQHQGRPQCQHRRRARLLGKMTRKGQGTDYGSIFGCDGDPVRTSVRLVESRHESDGHTGQLLQPGTLVLGPRTCPALINLLNGDDVGIQIADRHSGPCQIQLTIHAEPVADVEGGNPEIQCNLLVIHGIDTAKIDGSLWEH